MHRWGHRISTGLYSRVVAPSLAVPMKLYVLAIIVAVGAVVSGCSKQESTTPPEVPAEVPSTNAPAAP